MAENQQETRKFWQKIAVCCLAGGLVVGFLLGTGFGFGMGRAVKKIAGEKKAAKESSGEYAQIAKKVTLGKYKGVKISLIPTEEEMQNAIESEIQKYTNYEQKKGIARNGDMVYAEFSGSVNGVKKEELCGSDYVNIGSGEWLEDFEKGFIGMKTGRSKKISVKVPEGTYGNKSIDGRTVKFRLKLKYICGDAIEPEFNDEFVQSISDYQTVEEYREYLKKDLADTAEEEKAEYAWDEVLNASDIKEYPDEMIAAAKEEVLQGYYDMADMQGVSHDEVFQNFGCDDEQDFVDTELDELALDTVKEIMVAQAIANKEGISYTKKDYRTLLKDEYEDNKSSYDSEEDYEKSNQSYLKNNALINKVKDWIDKYAEYEREEKK